CPDTSALPRSLVYTTLDGVVAVHVTLKIGSSGTCNLVSAALIAGSSSYVDEWLTPMSSGNGREWLPTFGVSWQTVQVPGNSLTLSTSFNPVTFLIVIGNELKSCWPAAICFLASAFSFDPVKSLQASKSLKTEGVKPSTSPPSESLMPG